MRKRNKLKILVMIIIILLLLSLLTGCHFTSSDKTQIEKIADNLEYAIKEKDVDLFMENFSPNYSDTNGGTYDNHVNNMPEDMFSNIEDNENLANFFSIFKIEPQVNIPESDIVTSNIYAIGKMEIQITLEACIAWVLCSDLYHEITEYNVDFEKEEDGWKIISLTEI